MCLHIDNSLHFSGVTGMLVGKILGAVSGLEFEGSDSAPIFATNFK